jgi:hypothetical protein
MELLLTSSLATKAITERTHGRTQTKPWVRACDNFILCFALTVLCLGIVVLVVASGVCLVCFVSCFLGPAIRTVLHNIPIPLNAYVAPLCL